MNVPCRDHVSQSTVHSWSSFLTSSWSESGVLNKWDMYNMWGQVARTGIENRCYRRSPSAVEMPSLSSVINCPSNVSTMWSYCTRWPFLQPLSFILGVGMAWSENGPGGEGIIALTIFSYLFARQTLRVKLILTSVIQLLKYFWPWTENEQNFLFNLIA